MAAHLDHLTYTNIPPSDSETRQLNGLISDVETDISLLSDEIASVRALLHNLRRQRKHLSAQLSTYRNILSPVRRIPPELISKIFLQCRLSESFFWVGAEGFPLILCQICSGWRRVALGTPGLWNTFSIRLSEEHHAKLARLWFDRAHGSSLAVEVVSSHGHHDLSDSVVNALTPYFGRFHEVKLEVSAQQVNFLFSACLEPMHSLESISLCCAGEPMDSPLVVHAPRLRRVTLYRFPDFSTQTVHLPWSQLTQVLCDGMWIHSDILLDIFRQCTSLEICNCWINPRNTSSGLIILRNLHTFKLRSSDTLNAFLACLVIPQLKNFDVKSFSEWSHSSFISLQSRSSFDLEKLVLQKLTFHGPDLASFLRPMSSIRELEIRCTSCVDDKLLEMLTFRESIPEHLQLAPRLEVFKLTDRRPVFHDDFLADMVESRWRVNVGRNATSPVLGLRMVKIYVGWRQLNPLAAARFDECLEEGLDIEFMDNLSLDLPRSI